MSRFLRLLIQILVVQMGLLLGLFAAGNMGIVALGLSLTVILHYMPWVLALLPGIAIILYIYQRDRHEREPLPNLISAMVCGGLSTYPALKIEEFWIQTMNVYPSPDIQITFLFAFVVVAWSEEFAKFVFLRGVIYPQKEFDEPLDGIIYAVMLGMGFATVENIIYIIVRHGGVEVALLRMFTAVPAHAAFAVGMGYFLGLAKFQTNRWKKLGLLFASLFVPVLIHGLYDFFIFQQMSKTLAIFTFATLGLSIYMSHLLIDYHEKDSRDNQLKNLIRR
jgi:RsiW-degrading membrane proteinase PrsW (M82 family)